jgi:hypothetical protein
MVLAGSLLAAIAEARACRSMWGWATSPMLAARRAKARLAWLGLTGVPRSVRNTRSSWPAGFDPSKHDLLGLAAGETQVGLLAAVLTERLDGERWQGEDRAAGSGLDWPDRKFLAPAARAGVGIGQDGRVDDGEGPVESDGAGVQVQVGPFQAAQLAVAGPGCCRQDGPGSEPRAGVWSAASSSIATCSGARATTLRCGRGGGMAWLAGLRATSRQVTA